MRSTSGAMIMVLDATINNISAISWQSVLLVEETEKTTDLPQPIEKLYHTILYRVHLAKSGIQTHSLRCDLH